MKQLYRIVLLPIAFLLISLAEGRAQLNANFTANTTSGCNPMVVQFTDQSTGNPTSWSWDFGNGNTSSLQHPSATYTTAGSFTVTLTITNSAGSTHTKTMTNYITVHNSPTVDFVANDTAGCPPHAVQFTSQTTLNAPGTGSYYWNTGTGGTLTGQNPSFTYSNPGYYNVTHVVVNGAGCTTSVQKPAYIHVYTPPVANFGSSWPVLCGLAQAAQFNSQSTGTGPLSYQWDFGDGGTSTDPNPSHNYNTFDTFTVSLIVTDANGCKDTMVKPNYVAVVPTQAFFNAPASACEDEWITVTNTTPFTIYGNWNFGDGSLIDTNMTTVHQYTTPGTYTITLSVNNGTCNVFGSQTIVIHPKPTIDFSANVLTPCPAPTTIQFNNLTQNGTTYTWYFGDGGSSSQTNPSHVYTQNGFYDVTLVSSNGFGCSDSLTKLQYIKIFPSVLSIEASPGNGCIPVSDTFVAQLSSFDPTAGTSLPYPATITSYYWDFGDGTNSTQPTPVHVYANAGTYVVTLSITTSNGCTDTASIVISTGTPPIPQFTANPTSVCVDETVQFINNTTNALTYEWFFGDGSSSTDANPTHYYTDPGTYTITLIANNNGCKDTIVQQNYITVNDPKADFEVSYECDTLSKVSFTNTSINATSVLWDFGDGTTSTALNPVHVYPSLVSYTATLVAYNNITGCTDTTLQVIDLFDPAPDFTANDTAICPTEAPLFEASFPGSVFVNSYTWMFGTTVVPDTTASIVWPFYTGGYHDVSLIIVDLHGCPDTFTKNDYILVSDPAVNFVGSPVDICVPGTVNFTNTTQYIPGTYMTNSYWTFGNGGNLSSSGTTASSPYTIAGGYDVKLVVTDNVGCIDSAVKLTYIHAHDPAADFTVNNTNACVGTPLLFVNQSVGNQLSYSWDFGDGNTSTALSPSHPYMATGTYTVRLIITDAWGCRDTMIKTNYITVWNNPVAAFTLSDTFRICPPLFVQVTNNSTPNLVYNWDMGDGTQTVAVNPSHIYVDPGQYTVRLIAINNYGCRDTAYSQVDILGYNGVISYTPLTGCAPLTVSFTASITNVPGLVWDFSDGTTLATTATNVTHTYTEPGARVPRLIMTDNAGCSSTSYGLDTIKVDGVFAGYTFDPYPACDSGTLQFLDTSHGAYSTVTSRLWNFHTGMTDTSKTPSHYYPGPGDYIIKLYTSTSTGCLDTLTDTLTFYPLPVIDAGPDTTICLGDAATLMPGGGVSYTWTPAADLSCTNCTNPLASPDSQTVYTVVGTDINGCKNTDTVTVKLKTKTAATASGDGAICSGESLLLTASGAHNYQWIPPAGLDNPNADNPVATPAGTTTYMVISTEGSCIPDTDYVTVTVHPLPEVEAGPDQTIIAGNIAYIDASGTNATRWKWTPSNTLNCEDCEDPEATPPNTTTYHVTVETEFGCKDSDSITIHVICDQSQVFMPNSFTPNGDGQNDYFYPRGKGIQTIRSFRIYNRWGEMIFEKQGMATNAVNDGWDGTHKGQELPPDVFLYIVDAICDTGEPVTWKGDISLIR